MARRPTRARTSGQPGAQPARWPRHAEWVLAVGTLLLLGLAGGRARTTDTHMPQAAPLADYGPILIRAASLHDPARRYRVVATAAGQVVERSLDGVRWQTLLTPAFPKAAGTAAAAPSDTQGMPSDARPFPPRGRGSEGCPAAYTTVRALIPARSGPDIYVATAGENGDYLDGGCGGAIGGIFAIRTDGVAAPLGHDGLPFDQDPVGRTIRSYDVRGILVDPRYGSILYVQSGAGTGIGSPPPGLYKSTDSGVRWREIDAGLRPSTIYPCLPWPAGERLRSRHTADRGGQPGPAPVPERHRCVSQRGWRCLLAADGAEARGDTNAREGSGACTWP